GVYSEFVRLAAGPKAKIVVIPTAKEWPNREAMEGRFAAWREMSVSKLDFLDTGSREEANAEDFAKPLEDATGVWISGGSQGRLADIYGGTKVEEALKGVLERGGIIGGTSAGAAIMSRLMIRYGSPKAVVDAGFSFLSQAVVDQHFLRRHRQERLLGVLNEHPEMIGLGIDEGTALVVEGDHLRVMGQSEVVVCKQAAGEESPWVQTLKPGEEVDLVCPRAPADTPKLGGLVLEHRRPAEHHDGTNPPE
ncbi:MAG TPA: cyanophycinase, partial [Pirellulales bacterium]|nr:cyanophycinase [Pirellulales bacterium]